MDEREVQRAKTRREKWVQEKEAARATVIDREQKIKDLDARLDADAKKKRRQRDTHLKAVLGGEILATYVPSPDTAAYEHLTDGLIQWIAGSDGVDYPVIILNADRVRDLIQTLAAQAEAKRKKEEEKTKRAAEKASEKDAEKIAGDAGKDS